MGRQRRLKEGDANEEKWGEIDETLHKLDQKLRDSGRPVHGTKKVDMKFIIRTCVTVNTYELNYVLCFLQVANLATKFVKKDEPEASKASKEEVLLEKCNNTKHDFIYVTCKMRSHYY